MSGVTKKRKLSRQKTSNSARGQELQDKQQGHGRRSKVSTPQMSPVDQNRSKRRRRSRESGSSFGQCCGVARWTPQYAPVVTRSRSDKRRTPRSRRRSASSALRENPDRVRRYQGRRSADRPRAASLPRTPSRASSAARARPGTTGRSQPKNSSTRPRSPSCSASQPSSVARKHLDITVKSQARRKSDRPRSASLPHTPLRASSAARTCSGTTGKSYLMNSSTRRHSSSCSASQPSSVARKHSDSTVKSRARRSSDRPRSASLPRIALPASSGSTGKPRPRHGSTRRHPFSCSTSQPSSVVQKHSNTTGKPQARHSLAQTYFAPMPCTRLQSTLLQMVSERMEKTRATPSSDRSRHHAPCGSCKTCQMSQILQQKFLPPPQVPVKNFNLPRSLRSEVLARKQRVHSQNDFDLAPSLQPQFPVQNSEGRSENSFDLPPSLQPEVPAKKPEVHPRRNFDLPSSPQSEELAVKPQGDSQNNFDPASLPQDSAHRPQNHLDLPTSAQKMGGLRSPPCGTTVGRSSNTDGVEDQSQIVDSLSEYKAREASTAGGEEFADVPSPDRSDLKLCQNFMNLHKECGQFITADIFENILVLVTEVWVEFWHFVKNEGWALSTSVRREAVGGFRFVTAPDGVCTMWGDLLIYHELWLSEESRRGATDVIVKIYTYREGSVEPVDTVSWSIRDEMVLDIQCLVEHHNFVLSAWTTPDGAFMTKWPVRSRQPTGKTYSLNTKNVYSMRFVDDMVNFIVFHIPMKLLFYDYKKDCLVWSIQLQAKLLDNVLKVFRIEGGIQLIFETDRYIALASYMWDGETLIEHRRYTFVDDKIGRCTGLTLLGPNMFAAAFDNCLLQWRLHGVACEEPPYVVNRLDASGSSRIIMGSAGVITVNGKLVSTVVPDY